MSRLYTLISTIRPNRIKLVILSVIILFCLSPLSVWAQLYGSSMSYPIDAGYFGSCGSTSFMDYQNNDPSNGFGNTYGNYSDDVWYKITISNTTLVNISLCGSNFDTYLHLLNGSGIQIAYNDVQGPLCSGLQSSIQTTLSPGTYYIVAEGYSDLSGDLVVSISSTGGGSLPPGATLATAIDAGTLSSVFTDTKNNSPSSCFQNLMGQPSNEIYYKFTLTASSQVNISHCGTNFDTYMHLLNNNGTEIAYNDDGGPLCASFQASIQMTLNAGTYYVVSEGYWTNYGDIITSISKSSSAFVPPLGANFSQNQNYILTSTPSVSGFTDEASFSAKGSYDLTGEVQYFDGLGRPMQNVMIKGSPGVNRSEERRV